MKPATNKIQKPTSEIKHKTKRNVLVGGKQHEAILKELSEESGEAFAKRIQKVEFKRLPEEELGYTSEELDQITDQLLLEARKQIEIMGQLNVVGFNFCFDYYPLIYSKDRVIDQGELADRLMKKLVGFETDADIDGQIMINLEEEEE